MVMDVLWHRLCVRSVLLLPLVARCLETIYVCLWHMFVFMSVEVRVCGNVCCVVAVVKDRVFLPLSVVYQGCTFYSTLSSIFSLGLVSSKCY